ncbi:MAG: F0F1 ATP synthase subunit alpha [Candidatus Lloydbacteria bacterium RIFCSPHIGHO2_01_FULL_49_22]|uniref:ATP synthase subunit alpha n=1 Tax=Candidatus Lloydbacteria bacterium RIFCSPHIGHO2_01_FULL_49_22 TaxID=1798658 RepID=A0A1G2CUQ2_9BACT|nr:MAG: F0F1 ATP synthase subunit alpha [Candidatus Lloydbacteria bacterium RIFCSPHIGHO2_01_FULL_49_22]OGZ10245.1 MAG: F0F1 ATP synthase subunit alpha [Candidatus Lloydbacteria bacterium RIFCSPHIGHO2_02_FULL_50_18]
MEHIVEKLKKQIVDFTPKARSEKIGVVVTAADGIAEVDGLDGVMMGEMVMFDTGEGESLEENLSGENALLGMALNLEEDTVKVVVLGDAVKVKEGMTVKAMGSILSIPVGPELVGRVVNSLGEVLDGGIPLNTKQRNPIERKAYGVIERKSVSTPLHTGIKAIDGMVPIGRGQRELIIGDRQTGKTVVAIDTIINQLNEPVKDRPICIYVAIGQKESKVARIVQQLRDRGAMDYTIIVSASSSSSAALQFLAPFAGAAIGEYFMDAGKDALVVYDDLSKHAIAYRQMSLLLRRPPGREAYPGDIFYLHSRLLERAARLSDKMGGGSLTALPIIETQENDVSAYIPTNVISITDGQIYLETDLFNKGIRPAINVGVSVSRVGSSAQTKAMKKVAGKLRLELAQFRELEAFVQFSSDLDEDTKRRIEKGKLMVEILKQDKNVPLSFEKEVAIIFIAGSGLFDNADKSKVAEIEKGFFALCESQYAEVLRTIAESKDLSEDSQKILKEAAAAFKAASKELFVTA